MSPLLVTTILTLIRFGLERYGDRETQRTMDLAGRVVTLFQAGKHGQDDLRAIQHRLERAVQRGEGLSDEDWNELLERIDTDLTAIQRRADLARRTP